MSDKMIVIKPTKGIEAFNLLELWSWRELLFILTKKNISVTYRQTIAGALWVILQPLAMVGVFLFLFGRLGIHVETKGAPYSIILLSGILLWQSFSKSVSFGSASLSSNQALLTKVYFPRLLLPLSYVLSVVVDYFIVMAIFFVIIFVCKVKISLMGLLAFPLVVVMSSIVAFGISLSCASLGVFYRDIYIILPFLLQIGQFLSPVMYPLSVVSPKLQMIMAINPLTSIIEVFRWSLFPDYPFPEKIVILISCISLTCCVLMGILMFFRTTRYVSDIL